jgi:hypothetical protein
MSRNTRFSTILLLAVAPLAVLAADQNPAPAAGQAEAPPMFKELDKNHDGLIDQSEAKRSADVNARFSTLDTNKDKRISAAEWSAGEQSKSSGAAGVSGESRDQSSTGKSGDAMKPAPGY